MSRRPVLSSLVIVGVVAIGVFVAAPAGAITVGPLPPIGILQRTTTTNVPITCSFGNGSTNGGPPPVEHNVVRVTVTAPAIAFSLVPYTASFRVVLLDSTAPGSVSGFSLTSAFRMPGANPTNLSLTTAPQNIAPGAQPTFPTFSRQLTPALGTSTVTYRFRDVDYVFNLFGTIQASCTLDDGPVVMGSTTVPV